MDTDSKCTPRRAGSCSSPTSREVLHRKLRVPSIFGRNMQTQVAFPLKRCCLNHHPQQNAPITSDPRPSTNVLGVPKLSWCCHSHLSPNPIHLPIYFASTSTYPLVHLFLWAPGPNGLEHELSWDSLTWRALDMVHSRPKDGRGKGSMGSGSFHEFGRVL